jgi:ComF family protein
MADSLASHAVPGDVLVAVPLHPERLRHRGFNQSELLAAELGRLTGISEERGLLLRHRDTPPQARTGSADLRRENVAGAFACRDRRLKDRKVILVDDVCTSGATLDACAAALKRGGASSVWGLTLARET